MGAVDYIDTKATAKAILMDWWNQHDKLEQLPGRISEIQEKRRITERDQLKTDIAVRGLEKAWEYVQDITPVWNMLTDDERFLLKSRFIDYETGNGIKHIMERFCVERSEAYRRSDAALKRFAKLLFW